VKVHAGAFSVSNALKISLNMCLQQKTQVIDWHKYSTWHKKNRIQAVYDSSP
jgi:hypothetical protein